MISIDRILCPVDFSDFSRRALEYAAAMAKWYEARLTALHVASNVPVADVMPSFGLGGVYPVSLRDVDREMLVAQTKKFVAAVDADAAENVVLQEATDVRREILAQAVTLEADLVVMGSHGRGGFEHLLLGSVTEKTIRRARCPVMVVPAQAGGGNGQPVVPFTRILCPIDFSEGSKRGLAYALHLAQEADALLKLLHVIEMPPELKELPVSVDFDVNRARAAAEADCLQRLRALIPPTVKDFCKIRTEVVEGRAHREILRAAAEEEAELIVMGVNGRNAVDLMLFGSNTHGVLRGSTCPVLVVPR